MYGSGSQNRLTKSEFIIYSEVPVFKVEITFDSGIGIVFTGAGQNYCDQYYYYQETDNHRYSKGITYKLTTFGN